MITKAASQLMAGDVVRHTYSYMGDDQENSVYLVIQSDAYVDPDSAAGVVSTAVRGLWSTIVHTTEWTENEIVKVLTDDDRRRLGIPAFRYTCTHPETEIKQGHIPGMVRGSVYIEGTDFTECGRCERRWFRTRKAA